jgi:hypothetical protein
MMAKTQARTASVAAIPRKKLRRMTTPVQDAGLDNDWVSPTPFYLTFELPHGLRKQVFSAEYNEFTARQNAVFLGLKSEIARKSAEKGEFRLTFARHLLTFRFTVADCLTPFS